MSRLLQVLIAMVGLGITAMLGYASFQNDRLQNKNALLTLYSQSISAARLSCDADMAFVAKHAVANLEELDNAAKVNFAGLGPSADEISFVKQLHESTDDIIASMSTCVPAGAQTAPAAPAAPLAAAEPPAGAALAPSPAARSAKSVPLIAMATPSKNLELRLAESEAPAPARAAKGEGYYAVLASYGVDDKSTYDPQLGIVAHYNKLAPVAKEKGLTLQMVRTKISNHFALVLVGAPPTRDSARQLVLTARREGWAGDAFVELNRGWVTCDNPGTEAGLEACAKA
jgi:hypothetical protein